MSATAGRSVFTHLLIDEYQDTKIHATIPIAQLLSAGHRKPFVGRRLGSVRYTRSSGATSATSSTSNVTSLTPAAIGLSNNYRSTQRILRRECRHRTQREPARNRPGPTSARASRSARSSAGRAGRKGTPRRCAQWVARRGRRRATRCSLDSARTRSSRVLAARATWPTRLIGGARARRDQGRWRTCRRSTTRPTPSSRCDARSTSRGAASLVEHRVPLPPSLAHGGPSGRDHRSRGGRPRTAASGSGARVPDAHRAAPPRDRGAARRGGCRRCSIARLVAALEAQRDVEAGSRLENLQESSASPRSTSCARTSRRSRDSSRRCPALRGRRDRAGVRSGHADGTLHNAKGLELCLAWSSNRSSCLLDRGGEPRGGAPPLLRGDHASARAADVAVCGATHALPSPREEPPLAVPRPDPAEPHRARAARHRLVPGARIGGVGSARVGRAPPAAYDVPVLKVGDNVRHTQLGEGVVPRSTPAAQVVVRFRADGSSGACCSRTRRSTVFRPVGMLRARGAISSAWDTSRRSLVRTQDRPLREGPRYQGFSEWAILGSNQ